MSRYRRPTLSKVLEHHDIDEAREDLLEIDVHYGIVPKHAHAAIYRIIDRLIEHARDQQRITLHSIVGGGDPHKVHVDRTLRIGDNDARIQFAEVEILRRRVAVDGPRRNFVSGRAAAVRVGRAAGLPAGRGYDLIHADDRVGRLKQFLTRGAGVIQEELDVG